MKAITLFSGAGIDEFYLKDCGIDVILANEIISARAEAYKQLHENQNVVCDDICKSEVKDSIASFAIENNVDLIIATPPCQGLSWAGANKNLEALLGDKRNFLVLNAIDIIDRVMPNYVLIENVPRFAEMLFPYEGMLVSLKSLLQSKYGEDYNLDVQVLNAADYGVPQYRQRIVFRMWRKGLTWELPQPEEHVSLRDAIGNLPSIESGESTDIKNHFARKHPENHVTCMRYTPTGKTAYDNEVHFPQKANGEMIKGFKNTFKRMSWDKPAPTVTMRNDIISSQENVHPGRLLDDGTYSDARVLSLRELLIVSSMPADIDIPKNLTETSFRQIVGEGIPPLMLSKILNGISPKRIKAMSMFSGGGIAETYFEEIGIDVLVANELRPERAQFYKENHPNTKMICGDITRDEIFDSLIAEAKKDNIEFLIATPPCQGMSTLGLKQYDTDERNILFFYVIKAIDILKPNYLFIENVPKFLQLKYHYNDKLCDVIEILSDRYKDEYIVDYKILNAMHYGVPQSRPRLIIKMYKKNLVWEWPDEEPVITLREAIGDLPSLESGETSDIKWHNALVHNAMQIEALSHTPEGRSAMANEVYYPKKKDGTKVKGFHNTYKRMKWDEPAPARTTNSALISGHNNVHPGRLKPDGTWSDARVLTLRELIIVSSLPLSWNIPEQYKETFIREIIGEAIPPMLSKRIVEKILR